MTTLDRYEKKLLEAKQLFETVVLKLQEVQYELVREDVEYAFEIAQQVVENKAFKAFEALRQAKFLLEEAEEEAREARDEEGAALAQAEKINAQVTAFGKGFDDVTEEEGF
jgi:hypothetical protein